MKPFRLLTHLCAVVILVLFATSASAQVAWNHDPASDIGPNFWGSLSFPFAACGSQFDPVTNVLDGFVQVGLKQSPVDIVVASTIPTALPALTFQYNPTPFIIENTGHVVEVPYEAGSFLRVGQDTYQLLQFHLHAPSEHAINGVLADAELHLVHRNALLDLAVVGVMIKAGGPVNRLLDQILLNAPLDCPGVPPCEVELVGDINATEVLPPSQGYYNYSGSLTTPPCSEGVRWFVLKDPVFVTQRAITRFHQIIGRFPTYQPPINFRVWNDNNRPVRPLNGRAIWNQIP
ncbi:MAG: carbonic anhydrase [Chloroflexota bacterium]